MALNLTTLENALIDLLDTSVISHIGFGSTVTQAGEKWASQISLYVINISPSVSDLTAAEAAFVAVFETITISAADGLTKLEQSFDAYASEVAIEMGGGASAPPSTVDLSSVVLIGEAGGSGTQCALECADVLHTWFQTGDDGGGGPWV